MKNTEKWTINYNWKDYNYSIQDEIYSWEKAIRVICKWAWMNEIFAKEDLDLVLNEIIPNYLEIKTENNKSSNLQIRLRTMDKERIKQIAKKENLSVSDLILKKVLS